MKTRTQNPKTNRRRVFCATCYAIENAAELERLDDYDPREDTTSGGYIYGDDKSGDDWRALCDIFGV